MNDPRATTPVRIDANRAAGRVTIEWGDGHLTSYDAVPLRWLCPCAYCRGEAGQPGWLDSSPTLTEDQVRLVDLALVGNYALQPTWGDGHQSGFYSYTLLRDRCPCDACTRARASRDADHAGHAGHARPTGGSR